MMKKKTLTMKSPLRLLRLGLLLLCLLTGAGSASAGDTLRVLFIGNSYTDVNNLPEVVRKLANASGDSLYYKVSVPGGTTFEQHAALPATVNLIAQGGWDYVVLQEQSQRPSFNDAQVANEVYPYARKLDSLVHVYTPCAKTVFYMTWGRKNGDAGNCAVWPPVCTYQGMDSLLQLRYSIMAQQNNAMISPVAKVWRRLRNTTGAPELYQADESHPSPAGTYAAALSFYSLFFNKNPESNTFNFSLTAAQAALIRTAAKTVVYDSLGYWKRFSSWPWIDSIGYTRTGNAFTFSGVNPRNVLGYSWNFGDGSPGATQPAPTHTFATAGNYNVCVTVRNTCDTVTYCRTVNAGTTGITGPDPLQYVAVYPNPVKDKVQVTGLQTPVSFTLGNTAGVLVRSGSLSGKQAWIDMSVLPPGLYFLKLQTSTGAVKVLTLVK
ncbi:putative secreted protein (Por secretion system target) [Taibaiella chishuiensis]|uniref:Putative secreted protein (Por secretion system target) n=2 Tax=Taibaiella chishuiensis TaxID=1434707 RepID=A0A2P8DC87_9BACT|nr:putative secreted protein (Por secretion system target) [Taibaiella chishuiensis]